MRLSSYSLFFYLTVFLISGKRVLILNIDGVLFIMFLFPIFWHGAATNVDLFNLLTFAFVLAIVPA